jgi:putative transposase
MPAHIIQRGHNRAPTFRSVDEFRCYLSLLGDASRRFGCEIHAYVLMTNHVHLLATPEDPHGVSNMMQAIGRRFVRYVNKRHARTGSLWEGRFKSSVINSDQYLLTCSRYIELNPVRAGMVEDPGEYSWSSYRCNALGEPDALITPHALYDSLGMTDSDRLATYRALFALPIEPPTVARIQEAVRCGSVLGDSEFNERVEMLASELGSDQLI